MNLMNRLERIEKALNVDDDQIFIHIGAPCFTLYGAEAKAYYEQQVAAGRLTEPKTDGGFNVRRQIRVHLPPELEG